MDIALKCAGLFDIRSLNLFTIVLIFEFNVVFRPNILRIPVLDRLAGGPGGQVRRATDNHRSGLCRGD